ncbi:WD40-repeat-containing domain protein [Coemansia mojavensis]|nr:WD40-repeat-containing domain protein [Coemansia mojavensis]
MEANQSASQVYGIERHTLCLASVSGDSIHSRFALGTLGITEPSEIHLVDFDSDEKALSSTVYKHKCGIRALESTPWNPSQFLAINHSVSAASLPVELVELPEDNLETGSSVQDRPVRSIAELDISSAESSLPRSLACHPASHCQKAAIVSPTEVSIWEVGQGKLEQMSSIAASRYSLEEIQSAAWHPTNAFQLSTTDDICVRSWDLRADSKNMQTMTIDYAHSGKVRALDYNPNLPYIIASGGDDGCVRLWDTRNFSSPLLEIANHSHWIYCVAFNPNHDQLLLSAGADGLVNLESIVSVSSACAIAEIDYMSETGSASSSGKELSDTEEKPSDGLVAQYDDHETSVYAGKWSKADPWVFASLSFDGRLVINAVPQSEKYKILL